MKKNQNEVMVGTFVIIAFIILSVIVFFISGAFVFRSGYTVYVMYDYVSILDKGAPVRMAGVRVGEVSQVRLVEDSDVGRMRVRVKLFIEKKTQIRENYQFKIQGTHVLSEPHIEITPVPGEAPYVRDGKTVEGFDPIPLEALIKRAHEISEDLAEIVRGMHDALKNEKTGAAIQEIVLNLASLTRSMDKALGGGSGEDLQETVRHIRTSSDSLDKILSGLEKGQGTAGKLLKDDEVYQDLRAFVKDIKAHPWKLLKKDKKTFFFF